MEILPANNFVVKDTSTEDAGSTPFDPNFVFTDEKGTKIPVTQHDADTVYTDQGVGERIKGFDAAETPKITPTGAFSAGSRVGVAQTEATNQIIRDYGFTQQKVVGKDAFNRNIIDLVNPSGESLGSFLIKNKIVEPNRDTPDIDMTRRSLENFRVSTTNDPQVRSVDRARSIVDNALGRGTMIQAQQANTIEEYQDYVSATSNRGINAQEEAIKALEKRLQSPKISPEQHEKYLAQLERAKDSLQRNLNAPKGIFINSLEGVNTKRSSEAGRAWDLGWNGVKDSAANFLDYAGDLTNSTSIQKYGQNFLKNNERERRLIDVTAGDRDITGGTVTNFQDVQHDPTKVLQFIGNSFLQYGPQMAVMIGGSVAGGLVGGPVGASVVPMMMGIADVYGEMPDDEKSVTVATAAGMAIGLIDKLGFSRGAITAKHLVTKEGMQNLTEKVSVLKGISEKEASELLGKEITQLGTDYAMVVKNVATDQLKARHGFNDLIVDITKHAGKEASTELVQEVLQYGAITGSTSVDFDWKTMYERAKEAAVVGGLLGVGFNAPSAMGDIRDFNQKLSMLSGIETNPRTINSLMEEEEIRRNGKKLNDIELSNTLRSYQGSSKNAAGNDKSLNELIDTAKPTTLGQDFKSLMVNGGLFSSVRDNILRPFLQFQGGREIAGLFDASSVRGVYSGLSAFKRIHAIANSMTGLLPTNTDKRRMFGTDNDLDISNILLDSLHGNVTHKGAIEYRARLDAIAANLQAEIQSLGPFTGQDYLKLSEPDYFLKNQIVDPNLIRADPQEFMKLIQQYHVPQNIMGVKIDPAYVQDLIDRINDHMGPKELKELSDLGVLNNPVFSAFKSRNVESNVAKMIQMVSRSSVRSAIFGANGEVIAKGISKMLDANEITKEEAERLAVDTSQMLEAFDGKLNRPTSPLIRGATENLTFVTMLTYMDTSLFANLSEVVYGALGLSPANTVKYFGITAKEFALDVAAKFTQLGNKLSGGLIKSYEERELSDNNKSLQETGHFGSMNDIAFNVGANISTQSKQNLSKLMFKLNLVESVTNAARAARGAIACDEINNLVSIIAESPNNNDVTRWARDRLSYYRMDPDELVKLYNGVGNLSVDALNSLVAGDPLLDIARQQLMPGITNFIDEFSSRPEPGSAAKLFDDHRFALFTQFKKFTWHFTANVVPQLWNMYVKRGDVRYTYSAFSLMMLSYAVAYAGMYLKGAMRGDEEENDEKKLSKRLKQAFDYSVGGAYSDVYNTISSATETNSAGNLKRNPVETVIGLSPALNLVANTGKDVYAIATKEDDLKNKSNLIRRIPVFGEIPSIRHAFDKEK